MERKSTDWLVTCPNVFSPRNFHCQALWAIISLGWSVISVNVAKWLPPSLSVHGVRRKGNGFGDSQWRVPCGGICMFSWKPFWVMLRWIKTNEHWKRGRIEGCENSSQSRSKGTRHGNQWAVRDGEQTCRTGEQNDGAFAGPWASYSKWKWVALRKNQTDSKTMPNSQSSWIFSYLKEKCEDFRGI